MKAIFLAVFLFSTSVYGLTKAEFDSLDDFDKVEFLQNETEEIYSSEEIKKIIENNPEISKKIEAVGNYLSNVWYDTVLEGPYSLTSDTVIEISSVYVYNNEVYGYAAVVSADAIMIETLNCEYNDESEEWEGDCYNGYISERFYIDTDGNFIESDNYADFDS